jgi:elongation factor G
MARKLIEAVASYNDDLLERFFEDPDSITKEEMIETIRKATIDMSIVPVLCGASFKNKGVQRLLDAVVAFLPSPLDKGDIKEQILKTETRLYVSLLLQSHSAA